jgi:antirestriction protein
MSNAHIYPRVFVSTALKYSEGSNDGKWFELDEFENKEAFLEACINFHSDELCPELLFQSWQDVPQSYQDETTFHEDIFGYLEAIDTLDHEQTQAFQIFIDKVTNSLDYVSTMLSRFQEAYCGYFAKDFLMDSREKYAYHYFENLGIGDSFPDNLIIYFDFKVYARDLFIGDYVEYEGYVFSKF